MKISSKFHRNFHWNFTENSIASRQKVGLSKIYNFDDYFVVLIWAYKHLRKIAMKILHVTEEYILLSHARFSRKYGNTAISCVIPELS